MSIVSLKSLKSLSLNKVLPVLPVVLPICGEVAPLLVQKIVDMTVHKLAQEFSARGFSHQRGDAYAIHGISEIVFRRLSQELNILTIENIENTPVSDDPVLPVLQGIAPYFVSKILKQIHCKCADEFTALGLSFPVHACEIREIMQLVFHQLIHRFQRFSEEFRRLDEEEFDA